jgi:hypothetical protein
MTTTATPSTTALTSSSSAQPERPAFDGDHPELFSAEDNGATPTELGLAGCLTAGVAAVAQQRDIQLPNGQHRPQRHPRRRRPARRAPRRNHLRRDGPVLGGRCATSAPSPTSSSGDCSIPSTPGPPATVDQETPPPERFPAALVEESPPLTLDLTKGAIATTIWATGYHPDYSWLHVPVLDPKGELHHQGVTDAAGLYVIGTKFLRRHKSTFIDGAGDDARDLSEHRAGYLDRLSVR